MDQDRAFRKKNGTKNMPEFDYTTHFFFTFCHFFHFFFTFFFTFFHLFHFISLFFHFVSLFVTFCHFFHFFRGCNVGEDFFSGWKIFREDKVLRSTSSLSPSDPIAKVGPEFPQAENYIFVIT